MKIDEYINSGSSLIGGTEHIVHIFNVQLSIYWSLISERIGSNGLAKRFAEYGPQRINSIFEISIYMNTGIRILKNAFWQHQ